MAAYCTAAGGNYKSGEIATWCYNNQCTDDRCACVNECVKLYRVTNTRFAINKTNVCDYTYNYVSDVRDFCYTTCYE